MALLDYKIHKYVEKHRGCQQIDVCRAFPQFSDPWIRKKLEQLEKKGLITSKKTLNAKIYFPVEKPSRPFSPLSKITAMGTAFFWGLYFIFSFTPDLHDIKIIMGFDPTTGYNYAFPLSSLFIIAWFGFILSCSISAFVGIGGEVSYEKKKK